MLKDAGDRVYTMVYCGSLAGEMNVSFVVLDGASANALGDGRVCVEVV